MRQLVQGRVAYEIGVGWGEVGFPSTLDTHAQQLSMNKVPGSVRISKSTLFLHGVLEHPIGGMEEREEIGRRRTARARNNEVRKHAIKIRLNKLM